MKAGKAIDVAGIGLVVVEILSVFPLGIIAATDMNAQADSPFAYFSFSFLHLGRDGFGELGIDLEEVADFFAVFQEKVVESDIPSAHHDMTMAKHLAFERLVVAVAMLEAGSGQQADGCGIFGKEIPAETRERSVTDAKIAEFIAETHGNHFPPVLTPPCVNVGILQQVVAHLAFVAGENHGL